MTHLIPHESYSSYKIIVLLLDVSKTFDTVDYGQPFKDLKEGLKEGELHMISIS